MAQAWAETGRRLTTHIRKSVLVVRGDLKKIIIVVVSYLLTPCNRVLLETLTGSAASQEIPHIFGTRMFITVLTSAHHLSLF